MEQRIDIPKQGERIELIELDYNGREIITIDEDFFPYEWESSLDSETLGELEVQNPYESRGNDQMPGLSDTSYESIQSNDSGVLHLLCLLSTLDRENIDLDATQVSLKPTNVEFEDHSEHSYAELDTKSGDRFRSVRRMRGERGSD